MCTAAGIKQSILETHGFKPGRLNPLPGKIGHGNPLDIKGKLDPKSEDDTIGIDMNGGRKPSEVQSDRDEYNRRLYMSYQNQNAKSPLKSTAAQKLGS